MVREYLQNDKTFRRLYFIMCYWFIFTCFICTASAFTITTSEITSSSISWNISNIPVNVTVSELYFDGVAVSEFSTTTRNFIQSNLYPAESHSITVIDSTGVASEAFAITSGKAQSESDKLFSTINLWLVILLALIFVVCAIVIRINMLAYIGALFCFTGLVASVNTNFITGFISVIMLTVSLYVGFTLD